MKLEKKENRIRVKQTLLNIIMNHAEQGKIPPERILMEMLHVNRFMLRQCLDELIEENILYRKPRKGTYIQQWETKVVGFVADMGKDHPYGNMMNVISGVCRELDQNGDNTLIRFLNPEDPEDLWLLIRQYDVVACIIAHGGLPDTEVFLRPIPEEFRYKLVFVSPYAYGMHTQSAKYNYVEMASVGKMRVRQILQNKGRSPCVITKENNPSLSDIREELEQNSLSLDDSCLIHDVKKVRKLLEKLIRTKKIDSILCDGIGPEIFHTLFDVLQAHPEFTGPVSLADTRQIRHELSKFSSLHCKIVFSPYTTEELGKEAARMALRAAAEKKMQSPVFVKCDSTC